MSDLKISQLPALSGSDLASADQLAVVDSSASQTSKLTVGDLIANGVTLINDNTIPGAKILFDSGSIATAALADSGVTAVKIATDAITSAKIADNVIVALASTLPTSGGFIGQLALDTDDNSLYVWSGTTWLNTKAPASVNAFTDTTAGIINITTAVSSGTATVTASIDNTASAAQFLAGPVGSGGTVGYRTIDGGDLPTATTSAKGGVIVNGGGLTLSTDTIEIDNSVSASSVKHLVTYDANGLVTGGSVIASSDLPVATNSARGAVIVSDGLAVDASGNLSIDNTVTSGTYTKVTVTSKGVVSAGDTLAAADIPDHSAAKLTSGTIGSSLIANDSITAEKLANESTVKFGGALGSDNITIFPAGDFKGQLFWDETSLDLYVYTGSAFIPITVLSGNLVNAGTYNANTNLVSSITTAGSSAGFAVGSALPAPVGTNLNHYVVVDTSGTGTGAAPSVALAPPDMLLSQGVGTEYSLIDVSNAIAGQTASNISFIASGTIAATDVQAALQEVDTEKLPKAGGTMTGDLNLGTSTNVVFEGSSADDYETTLTVTNPTADRTITFPNVTGTVVTTGDTGSVTSTMIVDGAIVNADINASAEIAVSKLANGTARQLLQTDSGGSGVEFTSNVDVPGTLDVTSGATFDSTVAVTGLLSANGKLAYPAGTAAAVSLYSGSDTDTGVYSPGSNQFGISTAGTSRVVVDASGKVGIGTATPNRKLVVADTTNTVVAIEGATNGTSSLFLGDTADEDVGAFTYNHAGNHLEVTVNASEAMRIDSSGRLLLGTTTEGQDNSADNLTIADTGNCGITIRSGTANNGTITFSDATSGPAEYDGYIQYEQANQAFAFATASTEHMRIDSSGRLLVGASNSFDQNAKIQAATTGYEVFEGFQYGVNSVAAILRIGKSRGSIGNHGLVANNDQLGRISFMGNDGSSFKNAAYIFAAVDGTPGTNDMPTRLVFSTTADGASSPTERLQIDSSGNVGIGTTSPTQKLEIKHSNDVDTFAGLKITSNNQSAYVYYGWRGLDGSDQLRFSTGTTERMRITSSGNLLVGTTVDVTGNPNCKLQIASSGGAAIALARNDGSVVNNNDIGRIRFYSNDGGSYVESARIECAANGNHSASSKPTVLRFYTCVSGSASAALSLTIGTNGELFSVPTYQSTTSNAANMFIASNGNMARSTSSIKYKTNVETLLDTFADNVLNCRPVWYRSTAVNDNPEHGYWGFIAEEVAEIDPRLVHWKSVDISYDEDGNTVETECEPEPEGVQYDRFVPHLINLIKRQQTAIETLEAKVAALEAG